jgi:hypothetical protein
MRKLVIYRDDEALKRQASGYPLLWNFHAAKREGELDDGIGYAGHVDFRTMGEAVDWSGYDAVELVSIHLVELIEERLGEQQEQTKLDELAR